MIKTYDSNVRGKTKVFFVIDKEGKVISRIVGNQAINVDAGFQFYVDDYVADQIDKCEFYLEGLIPKLRLKEGEELEIPTDRKSTRLNSSHVAISYAVFCSKKKK